MVYYAHVASCREIDLQSQLCVGMNGRCTRLFKVHTCTVDYSWFICIIIGHPWGRYHDYSCTSYFQTVSGIAVGETRDDSKEFEYDYSYWSVDTSDDHFVSQEQVLNTMAPFGVMTLLNSKSHNTGIQRSRNHCNRISISGLQCLCVRVWANWIRKDLHYDGNWGYLVLYELGNFHY